MEELKMIENEKVKKAEEELEYLSGDEAERRIAYLRETAEIDRKFAMTAARDQGREEGKIEEKESVPVYAVPSVRSAVTNISNYLPMETIEDFKKTVFQYFSKGQSAVAFNEWELGVIDKLRKEKYIRDEWIFSR